MFRQNFAENIKLKPFLPYKFCRSNYFIAFILIEINAYLDRFQACANVTQALHNRIGYETPRPPPTLAEAFC